MDPWLPVLERGPIVLRPMTLDDAATHLAGEDEPTVRWLSGGPATIATVAAWIRRNLDSWERSGPVRAFGIRDSVDDRLVGMIEANLDLAGLRRGVACISYGLYPDARGRGLVTCAVDVVCDYLAEQTAVDTALLQIDPDNEPSLRVPHRTGFRPVGMRVTSQGERLLTFIRRL